MSLLVATLFVACYTLCIDVGRVARVSDGDTQTWKTCTRLEIRRTGDGVVRSLGASLGDGSRLATFGRLSALQRVAEKVYDDFTDHPEPKNQGSQ